MEKETETESFVDLKRRYVISKITFFVPYILVVVYVQGFSYMQIFKNLSNSCHSKISSTLHVDKM
jgi:hypothetical protein